MRTSKSLKKRPKHEPLDTLNGVLRITPSKMEDLNEIKTKGKGYHAKF